MMNTRINIILIALLAIAMPSFGQAKLPKLMVVPSDGHQGNGSQL